MVHSDIVPTKGKNGQVADLSTLVRRERRGSSHEPSIQVARGVYHRPGPFGAGQWG